MKIQTSAFVLVLMFAAGAACAKAGGEVSGGELTQAGEAATVSPVFVPPATGCVAAEALEDAGPDATPDQLALVEASAPLFNPGTTWHDLYTDIFAPTANAPSNVPGSCTFQTSCHGTANAAGFKAGIKCLDEADCYKSITNTTVTPDPETAGLVQPGDVDASILTTSRPIGRLRHCIDPQDASTSTNVVGDMPFAPTTFIYPAKTMERIRAWVRAGALQN